MNSGLSIIRQLRFFLLTTLLLSLVALIILTLTDKSDFHITINEFHSPFADVFFFFITYIGDGTFVAIAGIVISLLLLRKYGWTPLWFGALVLILSGGLAQVFKRFVFEDALRPSLYIDNAALYFAEGVEVHGHHSFPSGHTTAGFAFFAFASLFLARKRPFLQVSFAIIAGLIGYSRMYLSQHFLEDVLAGMILGTFVFIALVLVFGKRLPSN